jgi:hypothetical protein
LCVEIPDISAVIEGGQDDDSYGEKKYCKLSKLMEKANGIVSKCGNKLLENVGFDPREGNICFYSLSFG